MQLQLYKPPHILGQYPNVCITRTAILPKKYGDDDFHAKEVWMRPNSYMNGWIQRCFAESLFTPILSSLSKSNHSSKWPSKPLHIKAALLGNFACFDGVLVCNVPRGLYDWLTRRYAQAVPPNKNLLSVSKMFPWSVLTTLIFSDAIFRRRELTLTYLSDW